MFVEDPPATRSWPYRGGLVTLGMERLAVDQLAQTTLTLLRYERWHDGRLVESELDRFALRWWGMFELELALRAAGFEAIEIIGEHDPSRPARRSDGVLTVIARCCPA